MMHVWWNSPSSGNDRLVLLAIADEADDQGRNAFPSVRRLAEKANCHSATVLRSIIRLEKSGEIEVVRPKHQAPGRGNKYRVNLLPVPSPADIKARYQDEESETARKLLPVQKEQTARIGTPNRAHLDEKPRAQVRANPSDPLTQGKSRFSMGSVPEPRPHCPECDGTGWTLNESAEALPCTKCAA